MKRAAERPEDLLVPLVDTAERGSVYHRSIHRWALWGALLGGLVLGWLGWAMASGALPVAGLGQWAAAGEAVGCFTGAGLGIAGGGLAGALAAVFRLPRRTLDR